MRFLSLTVCVLCTFIFTGGCDKPSTQKKKSITRTEFESLVKDMTGADILKLVGKPDSTDKVRGVECWYYYNAATDPISGKPSKAQLVFGGDNTTKCQSVEWYLGSAQ